MGPIVAFLTKQTNAVSRELTAPQHPSISPPRLTATNYSITHMSHNIVRMLPSQNKAWPLAYRSQRELIGYTTADAYQVHELCVFGKPVLTLRLHVKRCAPETQEERSARYAASRARLNR